MANATTAQDTAANTRTYRAPTTRSEKRFTYWAIGAAVIIFAAVVYFFTEGHEVRPIDSGRTESQQMGNTPAVEPTTSR